MKSEDLKNIQAPLKDKYRTDPNTALIVLKASGKIGEGVSCNVDTGRSLVQAGLHPATGGTGMQVCSGNMLLEALVACAGVTLSAVATALEIKINDAAINAEGDLDFRGTLGISKDVPVGFTAIRLTFSLDCNEEQEKINTLLKLTERYCVVYQTLISGVAITTHLELYQ
jgi:uncharacterized OsmC-like protein